MHVERVGLLGFGSIGRVIAAGWSQLLPGLELTAACIREQQTDEARDILPARTELVYSMAELLVLRPTLIIEAAGQEAVRRYAVEILLSGCDLYLLSVGALADDALRQEIIAAAEKSDASVLIPAGAMAGFDGLLALRTHGLSKATYTSIKPPHAWNGTYAEKKHDLETIRERTVIFDGSAREAAQLFPKNANLAAAIAFASAGLDKTQVVLIADPDTQGNTGRVDAEGPEGQITVNVSGEASLENPKSSAIVGSSVLASLANRTSKLSFV
jgi:aspartate dehydrogenase